MPYDSYNRHYTDYRDLRLKTKPQRNLYNEVYEPITKTVIKFDYDETGDSELTHYRWEAARTEEQINHLEKTAKFYRKLCSFPVAIGSMNLTGTPNCYKKTMTWFQRRRSALDAWAEWEGVEINFRRDYYGDYVDNEAQQKQAQKEKAKDEFEYMTSGEGHNFYLNELAIEEGLNNHEKIFGERDTYSDLVGMREKSILTARQNFARIYERISIQASSREYDYTSSRYNTTPSCLAGDPTKIISSMRTVNKEIKDLEKDLAYFKEAFVSEWGENTVIATFDKPISELSKSNPYAEKRVLWESELESVKATRDSITERIASLNQHLEQLGTEERLVAQQEQRDILFRKRYERKLELKKNVEDRKQSVTDKEELRDAKTEMERIKKSRKGHGHMSSRDEEKKLYLSLEEAYEDLVKLYKKDKRKLEPYNYTVSIRYQKWCTHSRNRRWKSLDLDGWFLRTFQE